MESYIFVIAIIALYAFGITKFVYYKINKNSVKSKTSKLGFYFSGNGYTKN